MRITKNLISEELNASFRRRGVPEGDLSNNEDASENLDVDSLYTQHASVHLSTQLHSSQLYNFNMA